MSLFKNKKAYWLCLSSLFLFSQCHQNPPGIVAPSELTEQTTLPTAITESSGLATVNQQIWTHNDSGNKAELYQVNTAAEELIHTIHINDAHNRDWEDLAIDDAYLYIGDFGNNGGNRQDLQIYKIARSQVNTNVSDADITQTLSFHFEDQTTFDNEAYQHDFDCEAMIAHQNSLYLFSKNHKSQDCNLYRLSKTDSMGVAMKIDSFDTRGTITAADYQQDSNVLALLGYEFIEGDDMPAFLWLFYDFAGADFFQGKSAYVDLKLNSQAEGITFTDSLEVLISTEAENGGKGKLYSLDISAYVE